MRAVVALVALASVASVLAQAQVTTIPYNQLPVPAHTISTPSLPNPTTSTSLVMMGLAGTVTPKTSGTVRITITTTWANDTASDGCSAAARYGTGSAPANGTPDTGTNTGSNGYAMTNPSSGTMRTALTIDGLVTGLTVGTPYWIDAALRAVTGGTCNFGAPTIIAQEQ